MKRKLLVLAIAGAFVAPAAMADGNVSIYGEANASVDFTKDGAVNNSQSANKVSSNESFLGVKGSTDLGGGYAALFQVESAIALDGTAATGAGVTPAMIGSKLAGRDTFAGLSGGFGTVLAGTHDTPYKMATRGMDVFANTLADNRALSGGTGGIHDIRLGNVLAYVSPKIANSLTIVGAVVMGAENMTGALPGATKGSALSLAAMYGSGPIAASLAYQTITVGTAGTGTLGLAGPGLLANTKLSALKLGVGYNADQFGVNFVVERPSVSAPGGTSVNTTNFYLGGKFNVSSNDAIKAAYGKAGSASGAANGASQISVGYDHNLGKGTTLYALYSKVSNDTNGAFGLGQTADGEITGAVNGGAGSSPSAISVGMKYAF